MNKFSKLIIGAAAALLVVGTLSSTAFAYPEEALVARTKGLPPPPILPFTKRDHPLNPRQDDGGYGEGKDPSATPSAPSDDGTDPTPSTLGLPTSLPSALPSEIPSAIPSGPPPEIPTYVTSDLPLPSASALPSSLIPGFSSLLGASPLPLPTQPTSPPPYAPDATPTPTPASAVGAAHKIEISLISGVIIAGIASLFL